MKRFYWLLTLPYVVIGSSSPYRLIHEGNDQHFTFIEKEVADDFAASLNEAHERRRMDAQQKRLEDENRKLEDILSKSKLKEFDYKSACGQDDCGREP